MSDLTPHLPEGDAPRIEPMDMHEYHQLVAAWVQLHADAEGRVRCDGCQALCDPREAMVFRQETCISMSVAPETGELLAGMLFRFTLICPTCRQARAGQNEREVPVEQVQADVATLIEAADKSSRGEPLTEETGGGGESL